MKPAWILEAEKHMGLEEIAGPKHNPIILGFWKQIKRGGIKDDETPWCAAFVGACLEQAGIKSSRFEGAKSYLQWGIRLQNPTYGCIVVFVRDGGYHVGFVVGIDAKGRLLVLGGNQGNKVSIAPFEQKRVAAYVWPAGVDVPEGKLRVTVSHAETSTNEA